MAKAFSKIREELLYSSVAFSGKERIRNQINEDNRRVAVIWSLVEIVFWLFLMFVAIGDPEFERCINLYVVCLALSIATLVLAAFIAPKMPVVIRPTIIAMQLILLGAGVGLVFFQWDVRSATLIAIVLIVPVMFMTDTLPTVICMIASIAVILVAGPVIIVPEVFSWTLKTLPIFAIAGILLGHVINKARFERYAFEESALELAELRHKFAYYDELTGLQNRRAYSERIERLENGAAGGVCVVSLDVNGLKRTNDTYGHSAGDELMVGAATCLSESFEDAGEIYRLGGDEFCVITTESEEDVAKRLLHLEQATAGWKGKLVNGVSLSYGVAAAHDGQDIDWVLREADRKMYEFKRNYYMASGRDRRHLPDESSATLADTAHGLAV